MKKLVAIVDRYFFWIALVAVCCAIVGGYMLFDIQSNGSLVTEPLEPIWRGIKTLWGVDGYKYKLSDLKTWHQYVGYALYEFGRILGFLVFFRAMASLISTSFSTLKARHKVMRGIKRGENVVAVHGDSSYADVLIRNLTNRGMTVTFSDKRLLNHLGADYAGDLQELSVTLAAPSQVILFDKDSEAVEFLDETSAHMNEDAHIYVHLDDISTEGMMDERISLISMPEICAQLYWENYPIYPRGAVADVAASLVDVPHAGPVHRVVLVGEGDFTECILEQALLINIFDVPGGVRYDVLGSLHEWQMMHPGLAMALETNNDELYFHMGAWYEHRDLLYNADRIILCGDVSDNIRIANELQQEPIRALHVRADGESGLRIMGRSKPGSAGPEHVEVFGTKQQICTFGIILQDYVHERGKLRDIIYGLGTPRCNACPCFDFSGIPNVPRDWGITDEDREAIRDARLERMHDQGTDAISKCLTCPNFSNEWTAYDGFTRRSNYAVAAHDGQKFRLLRLLGIPVSHAMSVQEEIEGYQNLPRRTRDALQEIEHIRWCRFHFLNGWTYASGKKNKRMRTHPDLLPYWSLQTDRSKDADAYLNLCLMIRSPEEEQEFDRIWLGK